MRLSVITPSFRQLDWLWLCIASVADQPARQNDLAVEHIVQDAGSAGVEEFALEIAERLLNKYGGAQISDLAPCELLHLRTDCGYELRLFKEPDKGMYDAVNKGIKRASGIICSYINCDEQYLPGALKEVGDFFQSNPDADVVLGDTIIVNSEGMPIASRPALVPTLYNSMVGTTLSFYTAATFSRRAVFDQGFIFDTNWRDLGDAEWTSRIIKSDLRIRLLTKRTTTFTDTGANMNLSENARREKLKWRHMAPKLAIKLSFFVVIRYRMQKLLAGHYLQKPYHYSIFTLKNKLDRNTFEFKNPRPFWNQAKNSQQ